MTRYLPAAALLLAACGVQKAPEAPSLASNVAYAAQKPAAECEADINRSHFAVCRDGRDRTLSVSQNGAVEDHKIESNAYSFSRSMGAPITLSLWHYAGSYASQNIRPLNFSDKSNISFSYRFTGDPNSQAGEFNRVLLNGESVLTIYLGDGKFYSCPCTPVNLDDNGDMELFTDVGGQWAILDWNGKNPSEVKTGFDMVYRREDLEGRLLSEATAAKAEGSFKKHPLLNSLLVSMPGTSASELVGDLTRYRFGENAYSRRQNPDGTITVSGSMGKIDLRKLAEEASERQK